MLLNAPDCAKNATGLLLELRMLCQFPGCIESYTAHYLHAQARLAGGGRCFSTSCTARSSCGEEVLWPFFQPQSQGWNLLVTALNQEFTLSPSSQLLVRWGKHRKRRLILFSLFDTWSTRPHSFILVEALRSCWAKIGGRAKNPWWAWAILGLRVNSVLYLPAGPIFNMF